MPHYDYACRACEHEFEALQSITAPKKRKCPECGKFKLERLVSSSAGLVMGGRQYHLNKPYVARQIPLNHPDAPHHDKMGRAVFTSASEEREFMRKTGATRDGRTIEHGEYTSQVDANANKPLPEQEAWDVVRKKAQERGLLPRKGEPRSEMLRRQDNELRKQDKAVKAKQKRKEL